MFNSFAIASLATAILITPVQAQTRGAVSGTKGGGTTSHLHQGHSPGRRSGPVSYPYSYPYLDNDYGYGYDSESGPPPRESAPRQFLCRQRSQWRVRRSRC